MDQFFEEAPCGLLVVDLQGRILRSNRTFLGWLGATDDAIRGVQFTDLLEKGGKLYFDLFIVPTLRLQGSVSEISLELRGHSGPISCLLNASCFKSGEACPGLIFATIFEVADRKKYEDELIRKRSVAEKKDRQKSLALEDVAFDQAHLVRAPLANILGIIALLKDTELSPEVRDLVSLLDESSEKLDEVVKSIVHKTHTPA